MSLDALVWALHDAPVKRDERLILIYISQFSAGEWFTPQRETVIDISLLSGYEEEHVVEVIRGFVEDGLLVQIDGHLWIKTPGAKTPQESPWRSLARAEKARQQHNANPRPRNPNSARGRRFHKLADRDGWMCHYCQTPMVPFGEEPTYCNWVDTSSSPHGGWAEWRPRNGYALPGEDHKIPRIRGGSNGLENLVLCCKRCNSRKGTQDYDTFVARIAAEKVVA